VNVALELAVTDICALADADDDGMVTPAELLQAVGHALAGCPRQ
jgi:hypothetical protein